MTGLAGHPAEGTTLIELDSESRASLWKLFDRYPCLHGSVAAILEGGMGKVFVDAREAPRVALAVLDFHFPAGDPHDENAAPLLRLLRPGNVVITPTVAWQRLLAAAHPGELAAYPREAFQAEEFDADQLRRFCQMLPAGFELRRVRLEEVTQFATDLDPALVYNFRSQEEFITRGVGLGILHQGTFVSGASSAAVGGGKFEIEIQTHRQFRRRGLARAVAAALILYCLKHRIEPCWDAANEPSAALARQLGFHSTGKYEAYRVKPSEGKRAASGIVARRSPQPLCLEHEDPDCVVDAGQRPDPKIVGPATSAADADQVRPRVRRSTP